MATPGKQSGSGVNNYKEKLRSNQSAKPPTTGPLRATRNAITSVGTAVVSTASKLFPNRNIIKFYNRYDDYYEFTNFYHHPVHIDGHYWPTTEHYFQAQKFVGTPYYDHIRKLPFPRDAFQVSRDPEASKWIRKDWSAVKDDVMLKALRVKFQDESLKRRLLGTKDKTLVEHTSNDSYWGDGGDGRGMNKLGHLLMKVRDELRQAGNDYSGDNDDRSEYPIGASTLRKSSSYTNLSISSQDVTTRPTLGSLTNQHPVSFSSTRHSEPLKRRNSIGSHSSTKDLKPSNTTYQQLQITRYFGANTHGIGSTYSTGDSHQYSRRGNSNSSHQYSRGNSNSHSRGSASSSGYTHSSGNSRHHSHGGTDYSHHHGNSQYSYSAGPYGTPTLTRKSINLRPSCTAVSTHMNSTSRSKYSSNNGGYSSVTGAPSPHRDRSAHKNMSETASCFGSSLSTKAPAKFYGGGNNTNRGSNSPSTSYNIITHENY